MHCLPGFDSLGGKSKTKAAKIVKRKPLVLPSPAPISSCSLPPSHSHGSTPPPMATAEPGPSPPAPKPTCAVTFGRSTLLGRYLAAALAASGRWSAVAILDPSPTSPSPPPGPPASHIVYHHDVDFSDPARLVSALAGAAAVFHVDATTAAASGSDGSFLSLHRLAVEGTRRLLAACRAAGVGRVVYTGSADVVAAVARDVINADEDSAPYPDKVW
jgi:plant 3beta-hydroxysteroid-4alpha-carboxylate 3-dehydrogenase